MSFATESLEVKAIPIPDLTARINACEEPISAAILRFSSAMPAFLRCVSMEARDPDPVSLTRSGAVFNSLLGRMEFLYVDGATRISSSSRNFQLMAPPALARITLTRKPVFTASQ